MGRGKQKVLVIVETIDYEGFCITECIKTNPQSILHEIAEICKVQISYFMWPALVAHQRLRKYIFILTFSVQFASDPIGCCA